MKKNLYPFFLWLSLMGMRYGAEAQCNISVAPAYSSVCAGDSVTLAISSSPAGSFGNYQQVPMPVDTIATTLNIPIEVSGLPYNQLPAGALQSVCLNLACGITGQYNLFLTSPSGDNIQLSTGNGGFGNSGYNNTCFDPLAPQSITTYVYHPIPPNVVARPEQLNGFTNFTGTQANGTWILTIVRAVPGGAAGQFIWVTLNFGDPYTYSWTPTTGLSCPTCPVTNATPTQTTTYTLNATTANGCTAIATATVNVVSPPCQFPVAIDDTISTQHDIQISGSFLGNDILPIPVTATPFALVGPFHGGVVIAVDGSFTYSPNPFFVGTDTFIYEISAANGVYDTAQVLVRVFSGLVQPNLAATCTGVPVEIIGYPGYSAYQWSTGETTPSIWIATDGAYYLTLTDALGATFVDSSFLTVHPTPTALATNNGPLCHTPLAQLYGSGGVTYYWTAPNGGHSTEQNPLFWNYYGQVGPYCMTATDANGCTAQSCTTVQVYYASTSNDGPHCAGDTAHLHVSGLPGVSYTWHGPNGFTAFGQDVVIPNAQQSNTGLYWVTQGGACQQTQYGTYLRIYGQQDLGNLGVPWQARPGFLHSIYLEPYNRGCTYMNATMTLRYDSVITGNLLYGPPPSQFDPVAHTISWDYNNMPPLYTSQGFYVGFNLPWNVPLGSYLHHHLSILPIVGDENIADNDIDLVRLVSNAWDPNEITVSPTGTGPEGYITQADTSLLYTIHFQNTGNDTAFTVSLRDTLDLDVLDLESLEPVASSHPYQLMRDSANILIYYFDHIMLPDSGTNQDSSNGFVSYRIKLRQGLPIGTEIRNRAGIYFDYNEVVLTNTALNTIAAPVGIRTPVQALPLRVFPNPTSGATMLEFDLASASNVRVELKDLSGRLLELLSDNVVLPVGKNQLNVPMEAMPDGVYLIQVTTPEQTAVQKIMKQ